MHFHEAFSKDELELAHKIGKKGVEHYKKQEGSFLILESYIKIEHEIDQILNPDSYDPQQAAREEAQLLTISKDYESIRVSSLGFLPRSRAGNEI